MKQKEISTITYNEAKKLDQKLLNEYGIPIENLIKEAGKKISLWMNKHIQEKNIIGIIGKGNNGKDVLCAFLHYKKKCSLSLYTYDKSIHNNDIFKEVIKKKNVKIIESLPKNINQSFIIDGLFGVGINRKMNKKTIAIIKDINALNCPIISIDVPSGLNETKSDICITPTSILTMMLPKKVLYKKNNHSGTIFLINFDIPETAYYPFNYPKSSEPFIQLT